jgi:hypothetical protein
MGTRQRSGVADADSVTIDNERAAAEAVAHLLELGHRRIGVVAEASDRLAGPRVAGNRRKGLFPSAVRLRGYLRAIGAAGLEIDEGLIGSARYDRDSAYDATMRLLARDEPPTAILCTDNVLASGAFRAAQDRGLRMPEQLSLVGFDDEPWTTLVRPELTIVEQPTYDLGTRAGRQLLDRVTGGRDGRTTHVQLQAKLLVRGSTGASQRLTTSEASWTHRGSGVARPANSPAQNAASKPSVSDYHSSRTQRNFFSTRSIGPGRRALTKPSTRSWIIRSRPRAASRTANLTYRQVRPGHTDRHGVAGSKIKDNGEPAGQSMFSSGEASIRPSDRQGRPTQRAERLKHDFRTSHRDHREPFRNVSDSSGPMLAPGALHICRLQQPLQQERDRSRSEADQPWPGDTGRSPADREGLLDAAQCTRT